MEPGLVRLTIPKFRLTSPTRHTARGAAVPVGPTCHAITPRESQFTPPASRARHIARPPRRRSRRQPHHSASRFLLRFCIATQGPEQPAYSSLPHLSPAAPWELAISRISGRPVLGTMSGGQEDPEGSGDFDWSKLALSFILMRFFWKNKMSASTI